MAACPKNDSSKSFSVTEKVWQLNNIIILLYIIPYYTRYVYNIIYIPYIYQIYQSTFGRTQTGVEPTSNECLYEKKRAFYKNPIFQ